MSSNPSDYTVQLTYGTPIKQAGFTPVVVPIVKPESFNPDIFVDVHADWDVNDENGSKYIQNRTHWKETVDGETVYHKLDDNYLPNCHIGEDDETLVVI